MDAPLALHMIMYVDFPSGTDQRGRQRFDSRWHVGGITKYRGKRNFMMRFMAAKHKGDSMRCFNDRAVEECRCQWTGGSTLRVEMAPNRFVPCRAFPADFGRCES